MAAKKKNATSKKVTKPAAKAATPSNKSTSSKKTTTASKASASKPASASKAKAAQNDAPKANVKTVPAAKPAQPSKPQPAQPKSVAAKPVTTKPAAADVEIPRPTPCSAEERRQMIETAAYFIAEREQFRAHPESVWLEAEAQIDAQLADEGRAAAAV